MARGRQRLDVRIVSSFNRADFEITDELLSEATAPENLIARMK